MAKKNRTGRSSGTLGRFVGLPMYLLKTVAWKSLSPVARSAMIEVLQLYDGSNNGRLGMSGRRLANALGVSRGTGARALAQLCERGFLEVVTPSAFSMKSKRASEYRVTIHKCDASGKIPSKAFMGWKPEIHLTASPQSHLGLTTEPQGQNAT